jgi:signal transduction histidine kinase
MISLQNRLILTWGLFISLALGALAVVINLCTGVIFNALVRENIAEKSAEIARTIAGSYNPLIRSFDALSVETVGMYFVHEGYILSVEDEQGETVWSARSCDMGRCVEVINGITERMEGSFNVNGAMETKRYPLSFAGREIGTVTIETYGPFFYSETESHFLFSINQFLLAAAGVLILFSSALSVPLARAIARPVNRAARAARLIARLHGSEAPSWKAGAGGAFSVFDSKMAESGTKTRELAELAEAIGDLARELDEGERRQKQLTADIAHELRSPLTCLQGTVEAMIDGVYSPDPERLESCREEIIRLSKLVEDLHTLASLEWGESLEKTEFDLARLVLAVSDQFASAVREKGLYLRTPFSENAPVHADWDRLKQVFINLLSNALKFTERGGITITVKIFSEAGICVCFSDTGGGIPEEDLPRIFERFYRSDKSRSRSTGGSGIGLAIAAAIVHAHGGTLGAENLKDASGAVSGASFRVILPAAAVPPSSGAPRNVSHKKLTMR